MLGGITGALHTEFRSLEAGGPRGTAAVGAALSVSLAVLAALLLHSDEPWWAAISAWMVTRSSLAVAWSDAPYRQRCGCGDRRDCHRVVCLRSAALLPVPVRVGVRRSDRLCDVAARLCLADRGDHRRPGDADGARSPTNHIYDRR